LRQLRHNEIRLRATNGSPCALRQRFRLGSYLLWSTANSQGLAALNAEVTRQAAIIAYVNDFKLLFIVSLLMLPLLLMMRWSNGNAAAAELAAAEAKKGSRS